MYYCIIYSRIIKKVVFQNNHRLLSLKEEIIKIIELTRLTSHIHAHYSVLKVAFHLPSLVGPTSQFFNGTRKFSELVLFINQSRSVLLLQLAKAWAFGELCQENVDAYDLDNSLLNWPEPVLIGQPDFTN